MLKVSVIVPTCNRPHLIKRTIDSILKQTFQDFEIIVVVDGVKERAEEAVKSFGDSRIKYIQHETNKGGGAARNTGIKASQGEYIAFLDDDDEWLPNKLEKQVKVLDESGGDVGFCFTAVLNILDDRTEKSKVPDGLNDYHGLALASFKRFLTVTLIIKREVFDLVGLFDESLPSHQEAELMIRVTKKFKGIGINEPLVKVNMRSGHDHVGGNLAKRISGGELLIKKHIKEFELIPKILARHYFQLGIFCRDNKEETKAKKYFVMAWENNKLKISYLCHYTSL